ncbi:MAG: succinate dehydrogenase cytochrome b subunit [Flavobacteriales bacterium]|nr:succinate dehydrogenase cytochrome b subunit [Flavobacteriales bacterium]
MNALSFLLNSTIGKKIVMGLTGLFLISFLLVHCGVNSLIFFNDGGELFNEGAEFMGTNLLIRTVEILLFAGLILHSIQGLYLVYLNRKSRNVSYHVNSGKNSTWYSKSMGLLGTLILIFLILHLKHFWVTSRFTDQITGGYTTLFDEMKVVFSELWVVILYVFSMFSMAYHLLHGFQSAFQTLGLNHKKYTPFIKKLGFWFSIILPFLFAMMPISMYLGWIE